MLDLNRKIPPALAAEVLSATLLLLWRILEILRTGNYGDWLAVLAVYWLFNIVASGKRFWAPVTLAAAATLLLIYAWGEVPQALAVLGFSR